MSPVPHMTPNQIDVLKSLHYVRFKYRGAFDPPDGENGCKVWRGRGAKCYQITPAGLAVLT